MAVVVSRSRWRFICDECLTVYGNAVPDCIPMEGYVASSFLRSRQRYKPCECGGTFGWFPATVVQIDSYSVRMPGENTSWYS